MKVVVILLSAATMFSLSAESSGPSLTPEELVQLALSENPELRFYEQQVSALPKVSDAKPPIIAQPLEFPYREAFRRAVLNLDASLSRLHFDVFRFVLAGTVRLKAMEYRAATETAATANDLASRISALVRMLEERPAPGVEALIERRILEGAALPFLRQAAEANVKREILRTELNGLIGHPANDELNVSGSFALPPESPDSTTENPLLLQIRQAEIARGLIGLETASEIESFALASWFTREGLGATEAIAGITHPGTTAGSTIGERGVRLVEDARAKLARAHAQRRAAVKAAREVAAAISPQLIDNLRGASDLAERQYRVGALGVNLLVETHREYLDALEARNEAVIQAWRNSLDFELLTLSPSANPTAKVVNPREQ
jgi:outer membrane protein, heavy metal efflux system